MDSSTWAQIKRLFFVEKLSKRAIALRLSLDRKTIRRALSQPHTPPLRSPSLPKPAKLDPWKPYLQNRLKEYPTLSAVKLFIEIKPMGYPGGYSQVKRYLRDLRPPPQEAFLKIETLPGEQAQVDWANCGSIKIGSSNRKLSAFVMVMSYSRMIFVEFTISQRLEDFLSSHVHAFHFFGGIPKKILYDNLKTVVLARVGKDIRFQSAFLDFAGYHLFEPIPCNVAKANEKGKVENSIKYLRSSFLAGYSITSWPNLKLDAFHWQNNVANQRIHGTTRLRPCDRFEQEKPLLQLLPQKDYDTSITKSAPVTSQAFVLFDTNAYSVPGHYAGKTLTLKATADLVRILDGSKSIAQHNRSYEKYLTFEIPEHRANLLAAKRAAHVAKIQDAFQALGPLASDYLHGLLHAELHLQHHLKKIMDMVTLYGKTEVLQALEHALNFHAFGAPYIQNIILQQRTARNLTDPAPIQVHKKPHWTELTVEDQDLGIYDQLFED